MEMSPSCVVTATLPLADDRCCHYFNNNATRAACYVPPVKWSWINPPDQRNRRVTISLDGCSMMTSEAVATRTTMVPTLLLMMLPEVPWM